MFGGPTFRAHAHSDTIYVLVNSHNQSQPCVPTNGLPMSDPALLSYVALVDQIFATDPGSDVWNQANGVAADALHVPNTYGNPRQDVADLMVVATAGRPIRR